MFRHQPALSWQNLVLAIAVCFGVGWVAVQAIRMLPSAADCRDNWCRWRQATSPDGRFMLSLWRDKMESRVYVELAEGDRVLAQEMLAFEDDDWGDLDSGRSEFTWKNRAAWLSAAALRRLECVRTARE